MSSAMGPLGQKSNSFSEQDFETSSHQLLMRVANLIVKG